SSSAPAALASGAEESCAQPDPASRSAERPNSRVVCFVDRPTWFFIDPPSLSFIDPPTLSLPHVGGRGVQTTATARLCPYHIPRLSQYTNVGSAALVRWNTRGGERSNHGPAGDYGLAALPLVRLDEE